jgi:hypothetical protein
MITVKIPPHFAVGIPLNCIPGLLAEAFHPDTGHYTPNELAQIRYAVASKLDAETTKAAFDGSLRVRCKLGLASIEPSSFLSLGDVHSDFRFVTPKDLVEYLSDLDIKIEVFDPLAVALPVATASPAPEPKAAPVAPPADKATQPVQRGTAQDDVILNAIRKAGYDPLKLPKRQQGKRGIKADVQAALVGNHQFFPQVGTQFKKAWDRLRSRGEIAELK